MSACTHIRRPIGAAQSAASPVRARSNASAHATVTEEFRNRGGASLDRMRLAYDRQKAAANQRGIEWLFTFESWSEVWVASGKWHLRGSGGDAYCMARYGDAGPYAPQNVRIATNRENVRETRSARVRNALRVLGEQGPLTASAWEAACGLPAGTLGRHIAAYVRRGDICPVSSPFSRRTAMLYFPVIADTPQAAAVGERSYYPLTRSLA